jgi:C1A family cysteine protease
MLKKITLSLLICLFALTAAAQQYSRGADFDPEIYNRLPQKAVQLSRGYTGLAASVSLKNYAPFPGDQGKYSSCTAWASAFAARTMLESIAINRHDRTRTSGSVFSPVFVYKSISDDPLCKRGTMISRALDLMQKEGVPRMADFERNTDFIRVSPAMYRDSRKYTIGGYSTLFRFSRTEKSGPGGVTAVKKSLSEGKPVIIGMNTPDSFMKLKGKNLWKPLESPAVNWGGHAMCVVGYDDNFAGGAFELQNSWGTDWGDRGYGWVSYADFSRFVNEAYELIENLDEFKDRVEYTGFVDIELRNSGESMPVRFDTAGFYRTTRAYPSGTRFRYIMGNNSPAYVYAFASDSASGATTRIFPLDGISPVLDYRENAVAFPGEHSWIELDNISGVDYLVVLFAKRELDIDALRVRFERERGSFPERVARAAGTGYIPPSSARYDSGRLAFSAVMPNNRAVLGLLLAIEHSAR